MALLVLVLELVVVLVLLLIVKITPGELRLHQYSAVASICRYGAVKSIEIIKKRLYLTTTKSRKKAGLNDRSVMVPLSIIPIFGRGWYLYTLLTLYQHYNKLSIHHTAWFSLTPPVLRWSNIRDWRAVTDWSPGWGTEYWSVSGSPRLVEGGRGGGVARALVSPAPDTCDQ